MTRLLLRLALAAALLAIGEVARAQNPVVTQPAQTVSQNSSSTITTTNTFQSVFAAVTSSRGRSSCLIQNNGSHVMYVFFGPIANATTAASVALNPGTANVAGDAVSCVSGGIVLTDQVSITGTSGDAFYAAQQ